MKIEIELSRHEMKDRLERYIDSQVYQYWDHDWDHGMTLKQCVDEGADVPDIGQSPFGYTLTDHIEWTIRETYEEYFEEGFPRGGIPNALRIEIRDQVNYLMDLCYPMQPKRKKK